MKLITRDTDYAIRAVTCIAGENGKIVTVAALSSKLNMPKPFLRKILQILNKKGILKSFKGKAGGFAILQDPDKINILDLVEIFQGKFQLNEHVFKGKLCPSIKICSLKKKIDVIEEHVSEELKRITIKDILKDSKGHS